ncbi:MAG TPA: UDP-N-acetylmuramoyl-L-alanyl-D-glutamate--2,6-diaminopimelate ligase [Spirochaetota bacterium]|nr:UDP-N-acetylmuramoyl-L-alanyl-D-glutamate--2,6-diaminopimelate ligase [Spirochaetota bacterium]HOM37627.1 UDP-N-acetylmuramoyl-L-alanyl-D-glutamate--2,6-diaminopimelate ligase [Spirochaetota bacterium]HPQ49402.1 UDP-N-acetylmuramoyl-L-alanyl-D-glutamate--2,6-diaminopimelate ligase [Spirochaetota bacterium]
MKLKEILKVINIDYNSDESINNLVEDSRLANKNDLFVAIKGTNIDSHSFIDDVVSKGSFVIAQKGLYNKNKERVFFVDDTKKALTMLSKHYFDYPDSKLLIIGVTGTNGKTTTTYMIRSILEAEGIPTGIIGTIRYIIGDEIEDAKNTTPGQYQLYSLFNRMVKKGLKACVMEISSHSLIMGRVDSLDIDVAIFTNITQDHLDFHKTKEEYFKAKLLIFDLLAKSNKKNRLAVFNADIPESEHIKKYILDLGLKSISYGIKNGDIKAQISGFELSHNKFNVVLDDKKEIFIDTPMLGRFNVYNALASISAVKDIVKLSSIIKGLKSVKVDGRFESITTSLGFIVVIDYAHTPDALKNILETTKELNPVNIITVFGAGGDRDKTKRPLMGEIVSSLSNYTIITSDNPRTEDPYSIIEDIKKGIVGENYTIEPDRENAIKKAIFMADEGDIVIIAGKGHEDYQIIGNTKYHFSDKEIALKYIYEREANV